MMKAIIFGAAPTGWEEYEKIKEQYEIVAYCDNDSSKWYRELDHVPVIPPQDINNYEWDDVVIVSLTAMDVIKEQLLDMGIPSNRINTSYVEYKVRARESFVKDYASLINNHIILSGGKYVLQRQAFSRGNLQRL